jgi:hypothetical protein
LLSFVKTLGKEIAAAFTIFVLKKTIYDPIKATFDALLGPAKKIAGEIKGYFQEAIGFIMDSFFSIRGFVQSFEQGEQLAFKYSQAVADIATNLGVGTQEAEKLFDQADRIGDRLTMLPEDVLKLTESLNQAFGTTQTFSDQTVETFGILVTRLGLANDEAAEFVKLSQLSGQESENFTETTQNQIRALKARYNVAVSETAVMKEMANASSAIQLSMRSGGKNIVEAAFQAKKLGLELNQVEGIAGNLLNFEESIAKEMEAELLLGRNLNLDRARAAALNNDLATVASEISRQAGSAAEFGRMSVIQQEALAAAVGMSRNELGDLLKTQELLAGTGFEDMNAAQQDYLKLVEKLGSEEAAMAEMRQRGLSEELVNTVRKASAQELEQKRQEKLLRAQLDMAEAMMPVVRAFRDISQLVQDIRNVFIQQLRPFFKELGFSIKDAGKAMKNTLLDAAVKVGEKVNDIGLTLVKFARTHGPEIKKTFDTVLGVFGAIYSKIGEIISELFDLDETANIGDPLVRSLDLVQNIAENVTDYINSIDAESIASTIKGIASTIVGYYEGLIGMVKFIKDNPWSTLGIVAGGATLISQLVARGSRMNPMYTKSVDGVGGFKNIFEKLFGKQYKGGQMLPGGGRAAAGGQRAGGLLSSAGFAKSGVGQVGTKIATTLSPGMAAGGAGTALAGLGAAAGALSSAAFIGKGIYDVSQLDNKSTSGEKATAKGGALGAGGGALLGAAIGTAILPGVGTAIGSGIGAAVGYFGGRMVGSIEDYQDDLDKSRKRLTKSEEAASASRQLLQASQDQILAEANVRLKKQFTDLSSYDADGVLGMTKENLQKFGQQLLDTGKITQQDFQDAMSGVITPSELLQTALENTKTKFDTLNTKTQEVINLQIEEAKRKAAELYGDQARIEAQQNYVNTLIDEEGKLRTDLRENQSVAEEFGEKIRDIALERQGSLSLQYLDAGTIQKLLEAKTAEEVDLGPNVGKGAVEFYFSQAQKMAEETKNALMDAGATSLTQDQMRDAVTAAITSEAGSFTTEGVFSFDAVSQGVDMLGAGLSAVSKQLESDANNFAAEVAETTAKATTMGEITSKINSELNTLYESFNAFNGQAEAENLLNNIFDFKVGKEGQTLKQLLGKDQTSRLIEQASDGLDAEELKGLQDLITTLSTKQELEALDLQYLSDSIRKLATQELQVEDVEDGIIQSVQDGQALASKGPFTITDKFGATAVTAAGDGIVVSPNITRVQDGTIPTGTEFLLSQLDSRSLEGTQSSGNMKPGDAMAMLYRNAVVPSMFPDRQDQAGVMKELMSLPEQKQARILSNVAGSQSVQDGITGDPMKGADPANAIMAIKSPSQEQTSEFKIPEAVANIPNLTNLDLSGINRGATTISQGEGPISSTEMEMRQEIGRQRRGQQLAFESAVRRQQEKEEARENLAALVYMAKKEPGDFLQVLLGGISLGAEGIGHAFPLLEPIAQPVAITADLLNATISGIRAYYYATTGNPSKALVYSGLAGLSLSAAIPVAGVGANASQIATLIGKGKHLMHHGGEKVITAYKATDLGLKQGTKALGLNKGKGYSHLTAATDVTNAFISGEVNNLILNEAQEASNYITEVGNEYIQDFTQAFDTPSASDNANIAINLQKDPHSPESQIIVQRILKDAGLEGASVDFINKDVEHIQKVSDAASISNNGPFTIQDSKGNLAITHPDDKLVVSPNVSYISDGVSGKGGPVFPVSEQFGALDVKVGKSGVVVQKIKDGFTGLQELREAEEAGMPIESQPGAEIIGVRGPFTQGLTSIEPMQVGSRTYKGAGVIKKVYGLDSEGYESRREIQQEWLDDYKIAYQLSKKGINSQFAKTGTDSWFRTINFFERLVKQINRTEQKAIKENVPIFFYDFMAKEEERGSHDSIDYGTTIQRGLTEGSAGPIHYGTDGRPSYFTMGLNTFVEPSKLYKDYIPPTPEPEVTESILPERTIVPSPEIVTIRGTEGETFVTYKNGEVIDSSTIEQQQKAKEAGNYTYAAFDGIGGTLQTVNDGIGFWEVMHDPIGALKHYVLPSIVEGSGHLIEKIFHSKAFKPLFEKALGKTPIVGQLMHAGTGAYNINKLIKEGEISHDDLYQEVGKTALITIGGIAGGILGEVAMGALGLASGPGAVVLAMLGGVAGAMIGEIVAEAIADLIGARPIGKLITGFLTSDLDHLAPTQSPSLMSEPAPNLAMITPISDTLQKVSDGGALASRGPFTITDKFGATAITAKGDGVVVSPNISYVNDGMDGIASIDNMVANETPQNTTVIETTSTDTSALEQEVKDLKEIMAGFVQQMSQVVNRPVVVELDGNRVGESIGKNSYRIQ